MGYLSHAIWKQVVVWCWIKCFFPRLKPMCQVKTLSISLHTSTMVESKSLPIKALAQRTACLQLTIPVLAPPTLSTFCGIKPPVWSNYDPPGLTNAGMLAYNKPTPPSTCSQLFVPFLESTSLFGLWYQLLDWVLTKSYSN